MDYAYEINLRNRNHQSSSGSNNVDSEVQEWLDTMGRVMKKYPLLSKMSYGVDSIHYTDYIKGMQLLNKVSQVKVKTIDVEKKDEEKACAA